MPIQVTMTYCGESQDKHGMPDPWFHYLVIASPGVKPDSGTASIVSLSEARATGIAQGASHTVFAKSGGAAAAIQEAEAFLDGQHPGLKKLISDQKNS